MDVTLQLLIIEDSEADFLLIKRMLAKLERTVSCTRIDAEQMLDQALEQQNWDVILCDYNVPGMLFNTTRQKITSCCPDTPLILVSGELGVEQATDLLKQGVWDFVLKDNLGRLPSTLERALREADDHQARKQAEEALRLSEERLRLAIEGAALGTWHLEMQSETDGQAILSDHCCTLFGLPAGTVLNRDCFLEIVHPDDRDRVYQGLLEAAASGHDYSDEYRLILPDGALRWIASRAGVQRGSVAHETRMEGVVQDITTRKEAELVLIHAKEIAEATNRAKAELLAMISHELRTPLNGIFGGVQLLHMTTLNQEQQEYLNMVKISVGNELALVNDLLDLAQTEASGLNIISKDFSLKTCLADTIKIQSMSAKNKNLQLYLTIDSSVPDLLTGDQLRLRQILLNLLGNAIKFTEQGTVALNVKTTGKDPQGRQLIQFSVIDTGIGIAGENFERIFDPFIQVDMSNTRKYGGTGLGLAICQRLAALLGGKIRVGSTLGKGSTFLLELPFGLSGSVQTTTDSPLSGILPSYRILLVDDDDINLKVNCALLVKLGQQVVMANGGEEAITAWLKQPFDLMLLDIQMPGMTGEEVLAAVRRQEAAAGKTPTPIIALTAYAMPSDREKLLADGFDGYIPKPLLVAQVIQEISNVMGKMKAA